MQSTAQIPVPEAAVADFCRRYHIRRLALFGSVLRDDFHTDSDVDVLVEFQAGRAPGLFGLAGMELELSQILGGRRVDLNTPNCLSRYFRGSILAEAQVQYVES